MKAHVAAFCAAGLLCAVFGGGDRLQAQEVVTVVSFGGTWQDAERKAYFEPTAERLGITLREDQLRGVADVRLQVQGGSPTWDVVELGVQYCMTEDAEDLFEPLDFSAITNAEDLQANLKGERWVAGGAMASMVLAWNDETYGDNPPTSWKDFFDLENYPGARALYSQVRLMPEIALMADGVSPADLYPLDMDRALEKFGSISENIVAFYTSHGQAVQMVKDGEVDMIAILNGRVAEAINDGANFDFTFNQGLIFPGCWAVPKGAPNKSGAMRVINEFLAPDVQANLPRYYTYGPVNPKAFETGKITREQAETLNSSPENLKQQVVMDANWWALNESSVQMRWDEFMQR